MQQNDSLADTARSAIPQTLQKNPVSLSMCDTFLRLLLSTTITTKLESVTKHQQHTKGCSRN